MRLQSSLTSPTRGRVAPLLLLPLLLPLLLSLLLSLLLVSLAGCNPESERQSATAPTVEPGEVTPIDGIYDVAGHTVALRGGEKRELAGTVILRTVGDRYTATFKLDTTFPGASEPLSADVIGSGEGVVTGRTLTGSTKTQLVVSTVPGIDTDFAFVPRIVGARIVSSSVTDIAPDGSVSIELENRPAEGEDYEPTHTQLRGLRVADASGGAPDVAAGGAPAAVGRKPAN